MQLAQRPLPEGHFGEWRAELEGVNAEFPLSYPHRDDVIMPQHAIEVRAAAYQHTERACPECTICNVSVWCSFAPSSMGRRLAPRCCMRPCCRMGTSRVLG